MALSEILGVRETVKPNQQGGLDDVFVITFSTEATSGTHTIRVPVDDYSPELARERAEERARDIDAAFSE